MKSKCLEQYLLSKYGVDSIDNLDINKIEEISLNRVNDNIYQDYDFKDFEEFKKLKYISLQNFKIKNYETNELNRCKNLSAIQFSNCKFKSKCRLKGTIKVISFNNCKGLKLRYLSLLKNLEVLKILNFRSINLKYINLNIKNLEKAYFENTIIYNFASLSKLKNLILVELVNCKWNRKSKELFSKDVQIEE